jgi:ribonucleoside-diphosphate reductase alpha chain
VQRAAFAGGEDKAVVETMDTPKTDYEECLACQ